RRWFALRDAHPPFFAQITAPARGSGSRQLMPRWISLLTGLILAAALGVQSPPAGGTAYADAASPWLPRPSASGDDTYSGYVDVPSGGATVNTSSITVKGWVVDRTATGWSGVDDVQVYAGLADQGGTLLAHANIAQPRPDVATVLQS